MCQTQKSVPQLIRQGENKPGRCADLGVTCSEFPDSRRSVPHAETIKRAGWQMRSRPKPVAPRAGPRDIFLARKKMSCAENQCIFSHWENVERPHVTFLFQPPVNFRLPCALPCRTSGRLGKQTGQDICERFQWAFFPPLPDATADTLSALSPSLKALCLLHQGKTGRYVCAGITHLLPACRS